MQVYTLLACMRARVCMNNYNTMIKKQTSGYDYEYNE